MALSGEEGSLQRDEQVHRPWGFPARSVLGAVRSVWLERSEGAESPRDEVREKPSLWALRSRPLTGAFTVNEMEPQEANTAGAGSDVSETGSCCVDLG